MQYIGFICRHTAIFLPRIYGALFNNNERRAARRGAATAVMAELKFDDLFATDHAQSEEAKSVLRVLFTSFNRKQKKALALVREMPDLSLRCERVRKFFAEAIGSNVLQASAEGGSYSFRYASGGLCCIAEEFTEWLGWEDVSIVLETAELSSTKKLATAKPPQDEPVSVPEFDFEDFFSCWDDATVPSLENEDVSIPATVPVPVPKKDEINNYHTDSDALYVPSSVSDKIARNIEAVRVLRQIENRERELDREAQDIMSRYSGWGGAADLFDESNEKTKPQRDELKALLTEAEYESARASILSAFYTEPWVIQLIYETLMRFGFKGGTVLEPSMGIGNFFRFMPEELRASRLYGVELDSVTGRMAKQLFPSAKICLGGFETADFQCPDSFYDVVIGNVPFGNFKVFDPRFGNRFLIHDLFCAKALEKCRPNGIFAFVITKNSFDKKDTVLRQYLSEHGTFLGAIRLPAEAFKVYGGADVTTDILFFQRKAQEDGDAIPFVETVPFINPETGECVEGCLINEYFAANPEMVVGNLQPVTNQFGELTTVCRFNGTKEELIRQASEAAARISAVYEEGQSGIVEEDDIVSRIAYDPEEHSIRNYTYAYIDGVLRYREDNYLYGVNVSASAERRISFCCMVRDCLRNLLEMQREGCSDEQFEAGARELNRIYDRAVNKIGYLSSRANSLAFRDDADYPLLCSLESVDPNDEEHVTKSDIFSKRSIRPNLVLQPVNTVEDAVRCSLAQCGRLSPGIMRSIYNPYGEDVTGGAYMDKVAEECPDMFFRDPITKFWILADEYLTGDVRKKLIDAKGAAVLEPEEYDRNVNALQDACPPEVKIQDVGFQIGTPWITCEDYTKFLFEAVVPSAGEYAKKNVKVVYNSTLSLYDITLASQIKWYRECGHLGFGTRKMNAIDIIICALNGKPINVYRKDDSGRSVLDSEETMLAREKLTDLNAVFKEWLMKDKDRCRFYEDYYNLTYNGTVLRKYDGSGLTFPGANPSIQLRSYQRDAVARFIFGGNTGLFHTVGSGKSITMACCCMELRRLSIAHKPLVIMPKALLLQFMTEFLRMFPDANVIVASDRDFEKSRRRRFIARIATSSGFDACLMTHDQFGKIPVSNERKRQRIEQEIEKLEVCIADARSGSGRLFLKRLETAKRNLVASLQKLQDGQKDDFLCWELLGIDALFVDEAHLFKNLRVTTCLSCAGISTAASQRADDLKMKVDYLNERNHYRGVLFATGTPIANSIAELYTMTTYLRDDLLISRDIQAFDRWAAVFGEIRTEIELSVANEWIVKDRLSRFRNLPELTKLFHEFADVLTSEDLPIERPKLRGGAPIVVECQMDEFARGIQDSFLERAERIHSNLVRPDEDNFLKIANDARKLACDNRLMVTYDEMGEPIYGPYNMNGKIAHLVENVYDEYHRFDRIKFPATQVIFCDMGIPDGAQFNLYADIKMRLIEAGIPEEEIAFVHDAKTDQQRVELFRAVNSAKYRVLLGSAAKGGVGANFCTYLSACHILTCPWRPAEIEQMTGRIIRYGNRTPGSEVAVYHYVQVNSLDSFNWAIIERKAGFITSILRNDVLDRTCDDISEDVANYATIKAIATGDSSVKELMQVEVKLTQLKLRKTQYEKQRRELLQEYQVKLPEEIKRLRILIERLEADEKSAAELAEVDAWNLILDSENSYHGKEEIAAYLGERREKLPIREITGEFFGQLGAFKLLVNQIILPESGHCNCQMILAGEYNHTIDLFIHRGDAIVGRIVKALNDVPTKLLDARERLAQAEAAVITSKGQYEAPFEYESELHDTQERYDDLTATVMQSHN